MGIRYFRPDGSVFFQQSGGAAPSFTVSLRASNAVVGAENAGDSLVVAKGRDDFPIQGGTTGRALLGSVCTVVVAVAAVVTATAAVITLIIEITKDDDPPEIQNIDIDIDQNGDGQITIPIDSTYVNEDGTDLCDTCELDIEAGECQENCDSYDQDATNNGLQTNVLEV